MPGHGARPHRKETAIPTPTTIVAQPTPRRLPPPPNPANSPLGHYLLHPGQETSDFVHHLVHTLATFGRTAMPFAIAVATLVVVAGIVLAVSRRQGSTASGQLVTVAPGPEVDPAGAEVFWNALHGIFRRNWRAALLAGRPHVSFEMSRSGGNLAEWREILETAMRFATNCAKAYARASTQTRRRFNQAVFTRIEVRDGKVADVGYPPAVRPAPFFERVLYEEEPVVKARAVAPDRRAATEPGSRATGGAGVPEGPEGSLTPAWPEVARPGSWIWDRSLAAVRGCGVPCHGWRWAQFSIALVTGQDQVDGRIAPVAQFE